MRGKLWRRKKKKKKKKKKKNERAQENEIDPKNKKQKRGNRSHQFHGRSFHRSAGAACLQVLQSRSGESQLRLVLQAAPPRDA
jgi:hypothetical protein